MDNKTLIALAIGRERWNMFFIWKKRKDIRNIINSPPLKLVIFEFESVSVKKGFWANIDYTEKKQNRTIIVLLNNFYFLDFYNWRDDQLSEGRILKKHHRSDAFYKNSRKTDFWLI